MQRLLALLLALLASLVLYAAVFSVVQRPLTLGEIGRQLEFKRGHAATLAGPRLFVFAGSNGRYSHRCEMLTAATAMPCVNSSIAVGVGLDFLLEQLEQMLRPGDVVYMPLEYSQYAVSREQMDAGSKNAVLVHEQSDQLWRMDAGRIVRAWLSFDLPFLIHGVAEMLLERSGFKRRAGLESLTPQGDQRGHDAGLAAAYAGFLRHARFEPVDVPAASHARTVLEAHLRRAKEQGVRVVGGLPTIPDGVDVPDQAIESARRLFERSGHRFLVLPNGSRYRLSCFFDTLYHLNEECQIEHSRAVGAALVPILLPTPPIH